MSGTADLVSLANPSKRRYSPAVLTNWLRLDRLSVLRARLGKIVFHISERVLVIVSPRGGLQKLPGEQAGIAKAEVEPFIHLVFGGQIEFVADVPASPGAGWYRNRSTAGVKIIIGSSEPEAFKGLPDSPFLTEVFLHADPELHKIPAADLIGKTLFVMIGRIKTVEGIPVTTRGILGSRRVIAFEINPRRCRNAGKLLSPADIARPCTDGIYAERAFLPVKFSVVVEPRGKSALYVQADSDFIEVAVVDLFEELRVRGCDAPQNIRLEGAVWDDVVEASVNSVEVVPRKRAM